MIRALLALFAMAPVAAWAEDGFSNGTYLCERGVGLPATYVNGGTVSVVVLLVEGRQVTLQLEPSASGARYGWPGDGSNYVWWTKGATATLLWRDGATGTERPLLSDCVAN